MRRNSALAPWRGRQSTLEPAVLAAQFGKCYLRTRPELRQPGTQREGGGQTVQTGPFVCLTAVRAFPVALMMKWVSLSGTWGQTNVAFMTQGSGMASGSERCLLSLELLLIPFCSQRVRVYACVLLPPSYRVSRVHGEERTNMRLAPSRQRGTGQSATESPQQPARRAS